MTASKQEKTAAPHALRERDIATRRLGRRALLTGLPALGAGAAIAGSRMASAQVFVPQTQCFGVECDPGYNPQGSFGPPAGHGGNQGLPLEDTFGQCRQQTGYTDCDSGPTQDIGGCGTGLRGATGLTDSDGGTFADFAGCGRSGR